MWRLVLVALYMSWIARWRTIGCVANSTRTHTQKRVGTVLTPWGSLKTYPLNKAHQLAVQLLVRIAPPQRLPVAELPTADYHTVLTMLTDRIGSTYRVWLD